jgi:hypothetical protein
MPKFLGLRKSEEMYRLIKTPEKLEFLYRPSLHLSLFEEALEEK